MQLELKEIHLHGHDIKYLMRELSIQLFSIPANLYNESFDHKFMSLM